MPKYTNPKVPEGISSGHEHPLVDAAKSLTAVFAIILVVLFGSYVLARLAIPFIPFAWELKMTPGELNANEALSAEALDRQRYLQSLADKIAKASDLPDEMIITVHYLEDDTVNAFATLGGHVFVFEGIWKILDTENAMSMLLAHEIAHIKNRDPIRSAGSGVLAAIASGVLVGTDGFLASIFGGANLLTAMSFSRQQEMQADDDAASAVASLYGHLNGTGSLFTALLAETKDKSRLPEFLESHPDLQARIERHALRGRKFSGKLEGETTPLP